MHHEFVNNNYNIMKRKFLKSFDKLLLLILSVLSLPGCETRVEYGSPTADYEIKGTISDSITSAAIPNARIIVTLDQKYNALDSLQVYTDTLAIKETDIDGKYDVQISAFPLDSLTFKINVEDIDGVANGGDYATQKRNITFKFSDLQGGKGWYSGKAVKTLDLKLLRND